MKKSLLTLCFIFIGGCASIAPDSEMNAMGSNYFSQLKQKRTIETNPAINRYVRCVAKSLINNTSDPTGVKNWEVVVFRNDSANAFALPGGKIGVHTGLLKVAKTPGQLAAVLGHEIGHVIKRHGGKRMAKAKNAQLVTLGVGLGAAIGGEDPENYMLGAALITDLAFLRPHSRDNETEADIVGLNLMAKSGFHPGESVKLWQNMAKAQGRSVPQWLSTHPSSSKRIQDLQNRVPSVFTTYTQARAKSPSCK